MAIYTKVEHAKYLKLLERVSQLERENADLKSENADLLSQIKAFTSTRADTNKAEKTTTKKEA